MTEHKINTARTAVVATKAFWIPIDENTPHGVKMFLINKASGSATIGSLGAKELFFDHWFPMLAWPVVECSELNKGEQHAHP
jgi:hypothetical protein